MRKVYCIIERLLLSMREWPALTLSEYGLADNPQKSKSQIKSRTLKSACSAALLTPPSWWRDENYYFFFFKKKVLKMNFRIGSCTTKQRIMGRIHFCFVSPIIACWLFAAHKGPWTIHECKMDTAQIDSVTSHRHVWIMRFGFSLSHSKHISVTDLLKTWVSRASFLEKIVALFFSSLFFLEKQQIWTN